MSPREKTHSAKGEYDNCISGEAVHSDRIAARRHADTSRLKRWQSRIKRNGNRRRFSERPIEKFKFPVVYSKFSLGFSFSLLRGSTFVWGWLLVYGRQKYSTFYFNQINYVVEVRSNKCLFASNTFFVRIKHRFALNLRIIIG